SDLLMAQSEDWSRPQAEASLSRGPKVDLQSEAKKSVPDYNIVRVFMRRDRMSTGLSHLDFFYGAERSDTEGLALGKLITFLNCRSALSRRDFILSYQSGHWRLDQHQRQIVRSFRKLRVQN